jgi:hypothetical protein
MLRQPFTGLADNLQGPDNRIVDAKIGLELFEANPFDQRLDLYHRIKNIFEIIEIR